MLSEEQLEYYRKIAAGISGDVSELAWCIGMQNLLIDRNELVSEKALLRTFVEDSPEWGLLKRAKGAEAENTRLRAVVDAMVPILDGSPPLQDICGEQVCWYCGRDVTEHSQNCPWEIAQNALEANDAK